MTSVLQVVDSSGWIEVLTNGPQADRFLEVLDDEKSLIVPSITVFEVFKWILRENREAEAIQAIAVMHRGKIDDLDASIAIAAAQLSHALRLPLSQLSRNTNLLKLLRPLQKTERTLKV